MRKESENPSEKSTEGIAENAVGRTAEKKAGKSNIINIIILCVLSPIVIITGFFLFKGKNYYIICAALTVISMLPFFISFEKKKNASRETVAIAAVIALAVASRAVFYMLPEIKPIAAVVITAAVSFGYEVGFLAGSMSMLLSNVIFGQGIWTPFQMLGLGAVGLIFGLLFSSSKYRYNRWILGISGGVVTFIVYGLIVDFNSVLMLSADLSLASVVSVYIYGAPLNLVFGVTTAVCLILFGKPMIEKTERLKTKYGIFEKG